MINKERKLEVFGFFNRDIETNEIVNDFGEVVGRLDEQGNVHEVEGLWKVKEGKQT